jgi:Tol biopolymer transport system component
VARTEVLTVKAHDPGRVNQQLGLIRALRWSPDGTRLASAATDGGARVWEVAGGREVFALPTDHGVVWSLAWSPDGSGLAAGSEDGTIRVVEGLGHSPKIRAFPAHPGRVRSLAWSPRGNCLASGGGDSLVKLWDPSGVAMRARKLDHTGEVLGVAWSPDGKRLASAGNNRLVIAWDTERGRKLATMRGHNDYVDAAAWSPDGTRLASAGLDNSVRVWDPSTGEETLILRGDSGFFHDVSWHPDGARLAAACSDGRIWLWDATRGFERDTTPRALPYIDRAVASGTARGADLHRYAESYVRAGKRTQAMALLKADPDGSRPSHAQPPGDEQMAARLKSSGIAAHEQKRFAAAVVALEKASAEFQALRQAAPGDSGLAVEHASCLGHLAIALRSLQRPREALARDREGLAVFESIKAPGPLSCYNMAVACYRISNLLDPSSAGEREEFEARAVRYLRRAVEGDPGRYLARITDRGHFGRLRGRADFQGMVADAIFPPDPFVQPSPLSQSVPGTLSAEEAKPKVAKPVIPLDTAPAPARPDATGVLRLDAAQATLVGNKIRLETRGDQTNIGWWQYAADRASWQARFEKPGKYEVSLDLATVHAQAEFVVEIGDQKLTGTAPKTGDWDRFQGCSVGRVEIKSPGVQVIHVRARDAAGWKAINLRALRLSPAEPEGKPIR